MTAETNAAAQRVQAYLDRLSRATQRDKELIHGFDMGAPSEAALYADDLAALLRAGAAKVPEPDHAKDRLLAALERASAAESKLRALEDRLAVVPQWRETRGYHALVQVLYELQQDGHYSDEEGEETAALAELLASIETATPPAPDAGVVESKASA